MISALADGGSNEPHSRVIGSKSCDHSSHALLSIRFSRLRRADADAAAVGGGADSRGTIQRDPFRVVARRGVDRHAGVERGVDNAEGAEVEREEAVFAAGPSVVNEEDGEIQFAHIRRRVHVAVKTLAQARRQDDTQGCGAAGDRTAVFSRKRTGVGAAAPLIWTVRDQLGRRFVRLRHQIVLDE